MPTALPPEWRRFTDPETGIEVTQWTSHPSIHHHPYFTNPPVSADGREGYFLSYRTGYPNLFAIDLESGELRQLTDRVDINPFSPARVPSRPWIVFSARDSVWAADLDSGEEQRLASFPGARLGNCSCDAGGSTVAVGVRRDDGGELALIDLAGPTTQVACRFAEVGHIQFCPADHDLIEFSGTATQRICVFNRRTGRLTHPYPQQPTEWLVHETWRGRTTEIIFPRWPGELRGIRSDGSGSRLIASLNAWHICSSPDGRWIAADTNCPPRGIQLIDTRTGDARLLVNDGASCRGTQWALGTPAKGAGIDTSIIRSDTPEADTPPHPSDPAGTYGPQWTHPHPAFSPDGKLLVFCSDRDGWSQVYHVRLPEG